MFCSVHLFIFWLLIVGSVITLEDSVLSQKSFSPTDGLRFRGKLFVVYLVRKGRLLDTLGPVLSSV